MERKHKNLLARVELLSGGSKAQDKGIPEAMLFVGDPYGSRELHSILWIVGPRILAGKASNTAKLLQHFGAGGPRRLGCCSGT